MNNYYTTDPRTLRAAKTLGDDSNNNENPYKDATG